MADDQAQYVKQLLAAISPLSEADFDDTTSIPDLGISSLETQIFAARLEKSYQFKFDDGEIGQLFTLGELLAAIAKHTGG